MNRMRLSLSIAAATLAGAAITSASAHAAQVKFGGQHPIPEAVEGDFCHIEVPHVHIYEPEHPKVLYRVHADQYHFMGDPVAFGYDGPKNSYYGHHPVHVEPEIYVDVDVEPVTEFCYLDGAHFHHYAPPPDITFELKGGAYWYIGKYPKEYQKHKKHYTQINIIYKPIVYVRPVVVVVPPVGYLGPVIDVDVDVHAPDVVVERPHVGAAVRSGIDVDVHIPVPTIEVGIGVGVVGGIGVGHGHSHGHKHKRHGKHKKHRKWRH